MQIRDLPSTSTVESTDYLVKEQSDGTTQKIAVGDFVVNDLTSTATDKPGSANMLRVLNDKFSTQINSNYLVMTGTLGGDVINRANIASNGITFYVNSNVPTNSPPNIGYGAYLFLKSGPTGVSIFCWDNSHFACCYGLNPLTATSISWNVVK